MVETMEPASERTPISNEQTHQVAKFEEYLERNLLPKQYRVNIWSKPDMQCNEAHANTITTIILCPLHIKTLYLENEIYGALRRNACIFIRELGL